MSRNYFDLVRIEKLIDEEGFNVHFYQSSLVINRESSYNDRFLIGIQLAVAKHTSDKISQDVREHNRYKASKGIAPGPSPFGYQYDSGAKSHRIDPESKEICSYIFNEFDRTKSTLRDFVKHLNEKGFLTPNGRPWRTSNLHYMLTNPFYHGEFYYQERLWPGSHEPYYPKHRYEERLRRLGDGFRGQRKRNFEFHFSGLVRCDCGRLMTGEMKKGRYVYYGHQCARTSRTAYLSEGRLLDMLGEAVGETCFSPMFAANLKQYFKDAFDRRRRDSRAELDRVDRKLSAIDEKRGRLIELYTDAGIDRETLNQKMSELNSEADRLGRYRTACAGETGKILPEVIKAIDILRDDPAAFLKAPDERKAILFKSFADGVTVRGERLVINWKKPYSFLIRPALLKAKEDLEKAEPETAPALKRKRQPRSSRLSHHAPPAGQFQNAIDAIIEDFLLYLAG